LAYDRLVFNGLLLMGHVYKMNMPTDNIYYVDVDMTRVFLQNRREEGGLSPTGRHHAIDLVAVHVPRAPVPQLGVPATAM
jgi:hypothetical protein